MRKVALLLLEVATQTGYVGLESFSFKTDVEKKDVSIMCHDFDEPLTLHLPGKVTGTRTSKSLPAGSFEGTDLQIDGSDQLSP